MHREPGLFRRSRVIELGDTASVIAAYHAVEGMDGDRASKLASILRELTEQTIAGRVDMPVQLTGRAAAVAARALRRVVAERDDWRGSQAAAMLGVDYGSWDPEPGTPPTRHDSVAPVVVSEVDQTVDHIPVFDETHID